MREEYEIWALLAQVSKCMIEARANELRRAGPSPLTPAQIALLWATRRITRETDEPPTPAELSRWLFCQPPAIFSLLQRMQRRGLVKCERYEANRRELGVLVTAKGEEAFKSQGEKRDAIPRILGSLSKGEREQLKSLLSKLRHQALQEVMSKPLFP